MPDLSRRAVETELLDAGVPEDEAIRSLADLRLVNRWLGVGRSLLRVVRPLLAGVALPRILDVGCGSGDLAHLIVSRSAAPVLAVGVDIKLLHLRQAPPGVERVVADARRLPFPAASFDVVMVSHFMHHFDANEMAVVLRALFSLARRALVVSDLRRAAVPYFFGRAFFPLLFQAQVSVADGLLSIRRGFTAAELAAGFRDAGIERVRISRSFPYRLLAIAERGPSERRA